MHSSCIFLGPRMFRTQNLEFKVEGFKFSKTKVARLPKQKINIKYMFDNLSGKIRNMTVWPSGLRRWLKAPVRKGVGSNPTAVRLC